jgi:3'-phosphoadenosine 5'-phosphosulfate sulfotransferase (PAPS reductase)/FAD synthetase
MTQIELLPERYTEPEEYVAAALAAEGPVCATVCLVSGGGDSTVTAHRCRELYEELAFIDTGTALPGVRDFVVDYARWIDKPLRIYEAGPAYAELVLGDSRWWAFYREARRDGETLAQFVIRTTPHRKRGDGKGNAPQGFPGPGRGGHRAAYARLKERSVEALVRDLKAERAPGDRMARVALLSGARKYESRRRSMTQGVDGWRRRYAQVWVNPLNDWRDERMAEYKLEHRIPQSDVAALMHRSGECNCGAFMHAGELEDVKALYPDWYRELIAPLEDAAREAGIPRSVWGERTDTGRPGARGYDFSAADSYETQLSFVAPDDVRFTHEELCSSCAVNFDAAAG